MKSYIKLVTACGCSRVVESPVRMPYPKFYVPLSKPTAMYVFDEKLDVTVQQRRRVFEVDGPVVDLGDGDTMWVYREVLEG